MLQTYVYDNGVLLNMTKLQKMFIILAMALVCYYYMYSGKTSKKSNPYWGLFFKVMLLYICNTYIILFYISNYLKSIYSVHFKIYTHIQTRTDTHTHIYTHIHIYIYIYIYKYIYVYIHIY